MANFSGKEMEMARQAIKSSLSKSEKAQAHLKDSTWQHAMLAQGIAAYKLAIALIDGGIATEVSNDEACEALRFFKSAIDRVQKVLPKFEEGTAQHTLAVRRINAYTIAMDLIDGARKEG